MEKSISLYELAESYKDLENLEEVDIAPYLDAVQEQIETKVDSIVKFRQNLTATADVIQNEIDRLTVMKKRRESLAERLKGYLSSSMLANGFKEKGIDTGLFKLSFLKSTAVVVDDSQLDEKYIITKITKQADKIALKKALQSGEIISGASLEERSNLQIR
jgi:hypothetical protein